MAGEYTDPVSHAAQVFHQPAFSPYKGREWSGHPGTYQTPNFPPGRGWTQAVGAGRRPGELAGLGQVEQTMSTGAYAATSLLGATIGGAILGYVSSGDTEGAQTGALFSAGIGSLADAALFGRAGNPAGAMMMALVGLGTLGWSFARFQGAQRGRARGGSRR